MGGMGRLYQKMKNEKRGGEFEIKGENKRRREDRRNREKEKGFLVTSVAFLKAKELGHPAHIDEVFKQTRIRKSNGEFVDETSRRKVAGYICDGITYELKLVDTTYKLELVGIFYELEFVGVTYRLKLVGIIHGFNYP